MKKLTKISAGLLALCIVSGVFPGCSKIAAAFKKPVTIELWYGAADPGAGDIPADWQALPLIKKKLGIDLVLTALPADEGGQDAKILAAAAENTLPDLFPVSRSVWRHLITGGHIAPVDTFFDAMPIRTAQHYDADSRAHTTVDGVTYGFASPVSITKNEGVLIRKDWLDSLGLAVPVTTEDFFNVLTAFTEKDPDGNGRADTYGYGAFIDVYTYEEGLGRRFDPLFGAFGVAGTWSLDKESPGLNVRKPEYFDALSYVRSIVAAKAIDPKWPDYTKDEFRAAWKEGRFGVMREQNAAYAAESNYAPFDKNFPDGSWQVIDAPKGPEGKQSVGVFTQSYRIHAVSQKAADAGKSEAIARLLEWMSSEEGYFLLGFGEKGVNYVLDADGVPTVRGIPDESKGYTRPEMQNRTQLRNMVYYNGKIELLPRFPTYTTAVGHKRMSALDVLFAMQSRPWTAAIGSEALPIPNSALRRFYERGVADFISGRRELTKANWDTWLAEFDSRGGKAWETAGITAAQANGMLR